MPDTQEVFVKRKLKTDLWAQHCCPPGGLQQSRARFGGQNAMMSGFPTLRCMELGYSQVWQNRNGKKYHKACKITRKSTLAWGGTPSSRELAKGAAAAPPAGWDAAPPDGRGQTQGWHPCWMSEAGRDAQVGGAGPGRKCPQHLNIAWEGTGNRNLGPTWKHFLNYQEIRTRAGGVGTTLPQNCHSPPLPREGAGGSRNRGGLWGTRGSSPGKRQARAFIPNTAYQYPLDL